MTTPADLNRRAVTIRRETERVAMNMVMADVLAKRYCQMGVFIPSEVIMAHAREVATNAYDAARERERDEQVKARTREVVE